jgi:hypothetical protein
MWQVKKTEGNMPKDPFNDGIKVKGRLTLEEAKRVREKTKTEVGAGVRVWIAIDRSDDE